MPITTEPAPNAPPEGALRIRYFGTYDDSTWANGFWALTTGSPAAGDLSDLATDFLGAFVTDFLPSFHVNAAVTHCDLEYFTSTGSVPASSYDTNFGSDSSARLPASAAGVISWGTDERYRGGKPRTYLGGRAEGTLDTARIWKDSFVSQLSTDGAAFMGHVNAFTSGGLTTVTLGVYHFFSGGVALAPPTFAPFLSANGQKRVCTQRRRLGSEL